MIIVIILLTILVLIVAVANPDAARNVFTVIWALFVLGVVFALSCGVLFALYMGVTGQF